MRTPFVSTHQAIQLALPSDPLPCLGLLEELQQLLCRGTNYTNDVAWYVLHSGGLSLLCMVAQFGIPSVHSLCLSKEKKKKGKKERREESEAISFESRPPRGGQAHAACCLFRAVPCCVAMQ